MRTSARSGYNVIDREIPTLLATILAGVIVANEDFTAGEFDSRTRSPDEVDKPNDSRRREFSRRRANHRAVNLKNFSFAVDDEDDGTPDVADV